MPKISIVLPTYNGEKYISEAVESILSQTFEDWELIIVNDCSLDSTESIVNQYIKKDSRIKKISNKTNQKLPRSLNIGFFSAKGEYLTWTSDDNIFLPNALYEMNKYLDKNVNEVMVQAKYSLIDNNGRFLYESDRYDEETMYVNNCVGACFLYRREVLNTVGDYNPDKFLIEDYDYWLRILFRYGSIGSINTVLYKYRRHEDSLTNTRAKAIHMKLLELRMEYLDKLLKILINRKDLLCEIYYEFKQGDMINDHIKNNFFSIVPELKIDCEEVKHIPSVVYGAGYYGKIAYKKYMDIITCYIDKNKCGTYLYGKEIVAPSRINEFDEKYQILVAVGPHNVYTVLKTLLQYKVNKCSVICIGDK